MDDVVSQVFQVSDALGRSDNPPFLRAIHHIQKCPAVFQLNCINASEHLFQDDVEHARIPAHQVLESVELILRILFLYTDPRAIQVGTLQPENRLPHPLEVLLKYRANVIIQWRSTPERCASLTIGLLKSAATR